MKGILIILLLFLTGAAFTQNMTMTPLPTQQQLPVASVHCLLQDTEGYLWYGTEGGLCRDNGYQIDVFRPFETRRRQEACHINCLTEDGKGNIVVGSYDGLFYVDKADYAIRRIFLGGIEPADSVIAALHTDSKGGIWVGLIGHILLLDGNYQIQKDYPCTDGGKASSVSCLFEDSQGTLFALLWNRGILRMKKDGRRFEPLYWPLKSIPVQMMEDVQNHCYWVLTRGDGIVKMRIAEGSDVCEVELQHATISTSGRRNGLSMLRDSRNDLIWTTTTDDLYSYRIDSNGQLQPLDLSGFLSASRKILDNLLEDTSGRIYVAGWMPHTFIISSEQTGIMRHTIDPIQQHTGFPLLADRAVADGDNIWIWQGRIGLTLYNKDTGRLLFSPWAADRTIQRYGGISYSHHESGIWASHGSQVFRLWVENGKIEREDIATLPDGETVCCLSDDQHQSLWIASDHRLFRLSVISHQIKEIAQLPSHTIQMQADKLSNVYLALGASGLYMVSSKGTVSRLSKGIDESFIALSAQTDGTIWASTYEGNVYHYIPSKQQLKEEEEMCSADGSAIKSIVVDGMGHVWTMTDQQVREMVPQSHAFRLIRNTDPFVDAGYFYALEMIDQNVVGIDGAGAFIEVPSSSELNMQGNIQLHLASVVVGGQKRFPGKNKALMTLAPDEQTIELRLTTFTTPPTSAMPTCWMV